MTVASVACLPALLCSLMLAGADDDPVRMSLRGSAPDGMWETYTRRPSGLLFQQLNLKASGAQRTYPGLEEVNRAVEAVLRAEGLLTEGEYTPEQAPTLESGAWSALSEEALEPAKEALVAYYRDPEVRSPRMEASGQTNFVAQADGLVKQGYSHRRDEWEAISFWTIHTFVVASYLARGFLATEDPDRRAGYAQEFRDWVVAYAGYEHYPLIPEGARLGGPPYVWGDQWHMERSRRIAQAYFSFLAPDVEDVMSGPVPEYGGERFDFWCLKFALDQLMKADGLARGYRGGNHGWFQITAAVSMSLMLPEFKAADPALANALRRAVEHCLDDNRLDGWHRESTLSYMPTYLSHEQGVLDLLGANEGFLKGWTARTGVDLSPYIGTIERTVQRQQQAEEIVLLPGGHQPAFGDCGGGRRPLPRRTPQSVSDCLPGVGVYLMRTGWEASEDGRAEVGLAFNAMDELVAHNCSDLLAIMMYAYGECLLDKPPVYRYENSEHWYKRCTQSTNVAMPGDFADESGAPRQFGSAEMYGEDGRSWGKWPSNTAGIRFDQTGSGFPTSWRGARTNCGRVQAWRSGMNIDYVDAYHDRYVRSVESPWPTGEEPFGPRVRRSIVFVRSKVGGVGAYALVTDTFTNPTGRPLAGEYHDLNVLFHPPVPDTWRETGVPWGVEDTSKALRTRYQGTANLTIAPADPERLAVRHVVGLWTRRLRDGESQETGFGGRYSYLAPYVAYALPGRPAPVPDCFQAALFPDPPGEETELHVQRLTVSPADNSAQAAAVEVRFPEQGVRDVFLVASSPGSLRHFGEGACDGTAAWLRLLGDEVVAASLVNGEELSWGKFSLKGQRLRGRVVSSEPALEEGFIVNRLRLDGPPVPKACAGSLISLQGPLGQPVASYHVLRVLAEDEIVLSEARRTASRVSVVSVAPDAGTITTSATGLVPGQPLQVFQEGAAYLFQVADVNGQTVRVTAPDGSPADLSPLAGELRPGFAHAYDVLPAGCEYEMTTLTCWSRNQGDG